MSMRSATPEILGQTTGWFATRNERRTRQVEWCCNMHIRARKKCVTSKNGQNNLKEFGQANHLSSKYSVFFFICHVWACFRKPWAQFSAGSEEHAWTKGVLSELSSFSQWWKPSRSTHPMCKRLVCPHRHHSAFQKWAQHRTRHSLFNQSKHLQFKKLVQYKTWTCT